MTPETPEKQSQAVANSKTSGDGTGTGSESGGEDQEDSVTLEPMTRGRTWPKKTAPPTIPELQKLFFEVAENDEGSSVTQQPCTGQEHGSLDSRSGDEKSYVSDEGKGSQKLTNSEKEGKKSDKEDDSTDSDGSWDKVSIGSGSTHKNGPA